MIPADAQAPITPGLYPDLPYDRYRADQALGSGDIKAILRSPRHYLTRRQGGDRDSPAKAFGRAYHTAVLEPATWTARYAERPADVNWKSRTQREKFQREAAGREILAGSDVEKIRAMIGALQEHAGARYLLTRGGRAECSGFWLDPATGLPCKLRLDLLVDDDIVVDLKRAEDASENGFGRACANYDYHIQAAHYSAGLEVLGRKPKVFAFIAQEPEPPYAVGVYTLDPAAIELGMADRNRALDTLGRCYANETWPAYGEEIRNLMLPAWKHRQAANDNFNPGA